MEERYHIPVMPDECVQALNIHDAGIYVDATFGGGGHSREILKKMRSGKLIAFDQDEDAMRNAISDERFSFINQNFKYLKKMLRVKGIDQADGILADLGISSYQVDNAARGFAHRLEGPLDMRMDKNAQLTAEDIVNSYDQAHLQKIFSEYGEVRNARTLAELITDARNENEIETSEEFITVISPAIRGSRNRYLSQVFQALRIEVNDELEVLNEFLEQGAELLKSGGRLAVLTYHSLEDRIVKNFFRYGNTKGQPEKNFFGKEEKRFRIISKKPLQPSPQELKKNPRAHSAKLRVAEKI